MSRGIHDGIPGFVTVGAIDTHGPGAADDRVSAFSSDGRISLSAPGSRIPVGVDFDAETGKPRAKDVEGTSFASPYALQVAAAMSAANPKLSVDELERRLTDPRALHDIAGTTRDGAGVIDPFAAVLLARNPNLSREQIDAAQAALANPKADVRAIRRSLGL
jgi:subtilisin family serine protease